MSWVKELSRPWENRVFQSLFFFLVKSLDVGRHSLFTSRGILPHGWDEETQLMNGCVDG